MTKISLPGDNRAVDVSGYWIRAWHAVIDALTRNLDTAETTIEQHTAQIAAINSALADNDIVTTPTEETDTTDTATPEEPTEPDTTSVWNIAMKANDQEMIDTNGYFDDPDLQFAIDVDEAYAFRLVAQWQTENNADIQWRINGPTTPNRLVYQMTNLSNNGSRNEGVKNSYAVSQSRGSDQGRGTIEIDGVVHNGATAGLFVFQWGPDSDHNDITRMLKGSYLEYRKIS